MAKSLFSIGYTIDRYGSVVLDKLQLAVLPVATWNDSLPKALMSWREQGIRAIWIEIPKEKSEFIAAPVSCGFEFHHASKDSLMLSKWLPDTPSHLPSYATATVGVGAFVLNDKKEILMVIDHHGPSSTFWKLPGGAVDCGEDISAAAEREVLEETNIKASFISTIGFRQMRNFRFGKDDFYHLCILRAYGDNGLVLPKGQESEIIDVKWFPLEDALSLPHLQHWMGHIQPSVIAEVQRLFENEKLPCVGLRQVKVHNVVGKGVSSFYMAGMSNEWYNSCDINEPRLPLSRNKL